MRTLLCVLLVILVLIIGCEPRPLGLNLGGRLEEKIGPYSVSEEVVLVRSSWWDGTVVTTVCTVKTISGNTYVGSYTGGASIASHSAFIEAARRAGVE